METACKGVYASMDEARQAAEDVADTEYDVCNERRSVEEDIKRTPQIGYEDYPVLFWIQDMVRSGLRVTDLGGSTGETFYAFSQVLDFPKDMLWTVVELPAAAEKGRLVASRRDESRLEFKTDLSAAGDQDLLLTIGALQYMPQTLSEMTAELEKPPRDVIIHKVPTTDGSSFWTVQNLGVARVPYFVQNRTELVNSMRSLGYVMVDSCNTLRSIRLPYHPDNDVKHYSGFHFRNETLK